ncbi:NEAT domain-containing protein, partial [Micrococcus sp. SIMBA_144]
DFDALHATEDKASSMNRYFSPTGTLTVKDGKTFFSLEIIEQPGQDITEVLLANNGALQAGTLLSEEDLKRVEEFEIDGSSNIIPA